MVCVLVVAFPVFAQGIESLTYWDPIQNRNITVRVMHIGWEHHYTTIVNPGTRVARVLIYSSIKLTDTFAASSGVRSEWSEWELVDTEPKPFADMNELILRRNVVRDYYRMHPISGRQIGGNYLRISTPPSNRGEPGWFDENNYFNHFYKCYMVVP